MRKPAAGYEPVQTDDSPVGKSELDKSVELANGVNGGGASSSGSGAAGERA